MAQDTVQVHDTVPGSGTVRLHLPRPGRARTYTVQQVATKAPNVGTGAESALYLNGHYICELTPQAGAAQGEPYITVRPGSDLYVEWTGATSGATVQATFVYDDGV